MNRPLILIASAFLFLLGCTAPLTRLAEPPEGVVRIEAEPNHKIRFDNGAVRVYEVVLTKGQATLVHEHRADSFAVIFGNAEFINEPRGGKARTVKLPDGFVGFAPAAKNPYSHRAIASGDSTFHVAVLELLSPAPAGAPRASGRTDPPFKVVRASPRGRAYRITLAPGASTPPFARPAGSAIFAISAGRVAEEVDGKPDRLWDVEPGYFRWFETSETLSLKNEGSAPIDLVEIEVF